MQIRANVATLAIATIALLAIACPVRAATIQQGIEISVEPERIDVDQAENDARRVTAKITVKVNISMQALPGVVDGGDPRFTVSVSRGSVSGGNVVDDTFYVERNSQGVANGVFEFQYTSEENPAPGEVLISVEGGQGIRAAGQITEDYDTYTGGPIRLFLVGIGAATEPPFKSPFSPTRSARNPTAEIVQRAVIITALMVLLGWVAKTTVKSPKATAKATPAPFPAKPIPAEAATTNVHRADCDVTLGHRAQLVRANGEDRVEISASAVATLPGWEAKVASVENWKVDHPGFGTFGETSRTVESDRTLVNFMACTPWSNDDFSITVSATVVVTLTSLSTGQVQNKKVSVSAPALRIKGAHPKLILRPVWPEINATGTDSTWIGTDLFLFDELAPLGERLEILSAHGTVRGKKIDAQVAMRLIDRWPADGEERKKLWHAAENERGFHWIAPFLVRKTTDSEEVELAVQCAWSSGEMWSRARAASALPGPLEATCKLLLKTCTVVVNCQPDTFFPRSGEPLFVAAQLLDADAHGVNRPFRNESLHVAGAGITCEVRDLSQGLPGTTKHGCKLPPKHPLDTGIKASEDQAEAIFASGRALGTKPVFVDEQGQLYTLPAENAPIPRERRIHLCDYAFHRDTPTSTAQEPIHDGPLACKLTVVDGLQGKIEARGVRRAALGFLVLETGDEQFRIHEHRPTSFDVEFVPPPGFQAATGEELILRWDFAVFDQNNEPHPARLDASRKFSQEFKVGFATKYHLVIGHTRTDCAQYIHAKTGEVAAHATTWPADQKPSGPDWRFIEDHERTASLEIRRDWRACLAHQRVEQALRWLPEPEDRAWPWNDPFLLMAVRCELWDQRGNLVATSDRLSPALVGRTPGEDVWRDHRFGYVLLMLRLRLQDSLGNPYVGKKYKLVVDGKSLQEGVTQDKDHGLLEQLLPADANEGTLTLFEKSPDQPCCTFHLKLGCLAPLPPPSEAPWHDKPLASQIAGAQARLNNLGLFPKPTADGKPDEQLHRAVQRFQMLHGLVDGKGVPAGKLDEQTMDRLEGVHASGRTQRR